MQKKVVILGDSGVGKTSILLRYIQNKFEGSNLPTLGASFKSQMIQLPNENDQIKLNLWDTAGQEKFKSLTRMYYQDAEAAIIVYDITFRESFDSAKNWIEDLRNNANVPDILVAMVGNKCDLTDEAEVALEEAISFARSVKAEIIKETSAKDATGISELFLEIAQKLYKKQKAIEIQNKPASGGTGAQKPQPTKLQNSNSMAGGKSGGKQGKGGCCK
ncbi:ras-related protein rab-22a [Stylonychia lemnae]|uniref:Ras-related protein rab-22a n=1 Tax=Stylonychia lemnae TaxID=5949 RepID=A0A078B2Z7_STYLE|nr:ras-related protein rab-22a [Stylonychia lemnae]|eukprot:CDW88875.1 ras-related protein rab-22a [Stylonychia lemnae]